MEEAMDMPIDPAMAAAMTITAASKMAEIWLANPTNAAHLKSGWHVAVEVLVTQRPVELRISFVDTDGTRYPQALLQLPNACA